MSLQFGFLNVECHQNFEKGVYLKCCILNVYFEGLPLGKSEVKLTQFLGNTELLESSITMFFKLPRITFKINAG